MSGNQRLKSNPIDGLKKRNTTAKSNTRATITPVKQTTARKTGAVTGPNKQEDEYKSMSSRVRKSQIKTLKRIALEHEMTFQKVLEAVLTVGIPAYEAQLGQKD